MYLFPLTSQLTTPQVVTLHSPFPFDKVNSWTGDADSLYMEWVSMVPAVAISDCARREVKYPLNFVGVVHHGLPMEHFQPMTLQPENYFVWLGRMVPDKGTHLAIQAAKKAGVKLVLAGTIDSYSDQSLQYFEETIKPEIDGEQIKYIGPVNMRQKIDLLSHAAGFLNPIQWEEPFGMVLIEAMALGCPVISLSRGAATEIVVHHKTGFLVHDIADMVKFISRIGEIDRNVVRAHVVRNFSAHAMAEKYSRIYKRVIVMRKLDDVVSMPIAKSEKTRIPIITPPPVVVKKGDTVRVPYRARAASRATVEAETRS
jgi:glycosyltransferase involved in cell wall biosynthesis